MKNTIFQFETVARWCNGALGDRTGALGIPLFDGQKLARAKEILQNLDRKRYFGILELANNIALEKISWQIYKSPDYWDVLLLVNDIDPLFGMPYDFDIVSASTDDAISRYERTVYKRFMPDKDRARLHKHKAEHDSELNEEHRRIYYVYPERIYEIRQMLYEEGVINVS